MIAFRKTKTAPAPKPELIEARSYYGMSTHVIPLPTEDKPFPEALCGYSNWVATNSQIEVTADSVKESLTAQHSGWLWCAPCASKASGLSEQEIWAPLTR